VAKMTSICTFLSLDAVRHWPLYQMDVKNTFLHGGLSEIIYMQPPPGVTAWLGMYTDFNGLFTV